MYSNYLRPKNKGFNENYQPGPECFLDDEFVKVNMNWMDGWMYGSNISKCCCYQKRRKRDIKHNISMT